MLNIYVFVLSFGQVEADYCSFPFPYNLCVLYLCVWMWMCQCGGTYMHFAGQRLMLSVFLYHPLSYILRQSLSYWTQSSIFFLDWLASRLFESICPCSFFPPGLSLQKCTDVKGFYVCTKVPNTGPHIWVARHRPNLPFKKLFDTKCLLPIEAFRLGHLVHLCLI